MTSNVFFILTLFLSIFSIVHNADAVLFEADAIYSLPEKKASHVGAFLPVVNTAAAASTVSKGAAVLREAVGSSALQVTAEQQAAQERMDRVREEYLQKHLQKMARQLEESMQMAFPLPLPMPPPVLPLGAPAADASMAPAAAALGNAVHALSSFVWQRITGPGLLEKTFINMVHPGGGEGGMAATQGSHAAAGAMEESAGASRFLVPPVAKEREKEEEDPALRPKNIEAARARVLVSQAHGETRTWQENLPIFQNPVPQEGFAPVVVNWKDKVLETPILEEASAPKVETFPVAEGIGPNIFSTPAHAPQDTARVFYNEEAGAGTEVGVDVEGNDVLDHQLKKPYDPHQMQDTLVVNNPDSTVQAHTIARPGAPNAKLAGSAHAETGVPFDHRGFPIFEKDVIFETRLPSDIILKRSQTHMREATKHLREAIEKGQIPKSNFNTKQLQDIYQNNYKIDGFTWHHHQEIGRMQLVKEETHNIVKHEGGMSKWKN